MSAETVEAIEAELAHLRGDVNPAADGVRTNILDLVVFTYDEGTAAELFDTIEALPSNRPSRAIVALGRNDDSPLHTEARAVCAPGVMRPICSELVLVSEGDTAGLPSLISALLLPDLPVFLLWRAPADDEEALTRFWPLATRVVVDSTLVPHTLEHLAALVDRRPERAVTDLSWTKITGWRDCVARLFDVPENAAALARMDSVSIRHAGASSAQAQLLAAWLRASTELDPAFEIVSDDRADMRSGSLVQVEIRSGEERFAVSRRSEGVARLAGERMPTQDVRLRVPHAPALLASELEVFGRDEIFERAVKGAAVNLNVLETPEAAVTRFCELLADAAPRTFVCTGGGVAGEAYRRLAAPEWQMRIDWSSVELFLGDERCVPVESPESNYRLVRDALLRVVQPQRVERMRGEAADPDAEAKRYGELLPDRFDVTMLGMGDDGHVASLFPGEPAVDEERRLCMYSRAHYAPFGRLTLTLPALNRSARVFMLTVGERKAEALAAVAAGENLPAARVRPVDGEVVWVVDRAAASRLA